MGKLVDRKRHWLAKRRDAGRDRAPPAEALDGVAALYARIASPSEGAIASETAVRLERAFDALPKEYRRVITLSRVVGMSHAQIAKELDRNEGAVRVLLHRALARLGRLMDEDGSGGDSRS